MQVATRAVGSRFAVHGWVVGALVALVTTLSLVLWLHPTAGVVDSGILRGADLRFWMIQVLWWHLLALVAASTAVAAITPTRWGAPRHCLVYVAGLAATVAANPIIDKFY